ncbi:MAG: GtrA family protein [Bifidobacteriaceae bacterium]|jgi:putative flippase GtrA|nr:GtrA family protein [Bifidobacteriaceae bacterium]
MRCWRHPEVQQIIRYGLVAVVAFAVDFGTMTAFVEFVGWNHLVAAAAGFVLGLIANYLLSERLVFGQPKVRSGLTRFASFAVIGLVGLGILEVAMYVQVDLLDWHYQLAKIVATVIGFVWNYAARRVLYKTRGTVSKLEES